MLLWKKIAGDFPISMASSSKNQSSQYFQLTLIAALFLHGWMFNFSSIGSWKNITSGYVWLWHEWNLILQNPANNDEVNSSSTQVDVLHAGRNFALFRFVLFLVSQSYLFLQYLEFSTNLLALSKFYRIRRYYFSNEYIILEL